MHWLDEAYEPFHKAPNSSTKITLVAYISSNLILRQQYAYIYFPFRVQLTCYLQLKMESEMMNSLFCKYIRV